MTFPRKHGFTDYDVRIYFTYVQFQHILTFLQKYPEFLPEVTEWLWMQVAADITILCSSVIIVLFVF